MSTPWFFLSYSRFDREHDKEVKRFFKDLARQVRFCSGKQVSEKEVGFLDLGMSNGTRWPWKLAANLSQCRVLVCLYSQSYFESKFCGKEFSIFQSRIEQFESDHPGAEPPPCIKTVLWQIPEDFPACLPPALGETHYDEQCLEEWGEAGGLYVFKNISPDRYSIYVSKLAREICAAAMSQPRLPSLAQVPEFKKVQSAFHQRLEPPLDPTSLRVASAAWNKVSLAWDSNSDNELGFELARREGRDSDFSTPRQTGNGITEFSDRQVEPETSYAYRVRAFNEDGESGWSKEVPALTPPRPRRVIYLRIAAVAALALLAFGIAALAPRIRGMFFNGNGNGGGGTNANSNIRVDPPPAPSPWSDYFKRKSNSEKDDTQWVESEKWDLPGAGWQLRPESLEGALLVSGQNPGVYKDKDALQGSFDLDFEIRFRASKDKIILPEATRAGWIIHAQGDRQKGYSGYLFVLERPKQGPLELNVYYGEWGKNPSALKTGVSAGITQYGKDNTDSVRVLVRVEGRKFTYSFQLLSTKDRPEVNKCFTQALDFTNTPRPDEGEFVPGRIGLFGPDDGKPFLVKYVSVAPVAPDSPLKDPNCKQK